MKVLCIGHSAYDISTLMDSYPEENTKIVLKDVHEAAGGSMSNVAYLFGKFGVETYLGSVVGDDSFGNFIKKDLETVNVHIEYMETAYDKRTHRCIILINKTLGTRTVLKIAKDELFLKKTEFPMEPDLVMIDAYDYGAALSAVNKYAHKITIIDADEYNDNTVELCKYCKYIIASKNFAEKVAGQKINIDNPQDMVSVYTKLVNKYPDKNLIVTIEDKGALYMVDNQIRVMPGLQVETVDTTGAGDVFHGAFGYALLEGYDIEKAITFANIAAGLSTTKVGAHAGVPDISDIMTYFKQKYPDAQTSTQGN